MNRLKFFRSIVANFVIALVVFGILMVTVSNNSFFASNAEAPIYKGKSEKNVAIMINVYWGTEFVDTMLNTLKKHNAKATFFIGGSWAAKNEAVLKQIYDDGHEIGNHGYYHKDHKTLSKERNREEILITHNLIKNILGVNMNLFAPPSGSFDKATLEIAESLDYKTVMWSRDTIDWRDHDTNVILSRATKNIKGGELILMHPTKNTMDALDGIITNIKKAGLNLATVSETL